MEEQKTQPGRRGGTLLVGGNHGGGRPKKTTLDEALERVLSETKLVHGEEMTAEEAMVRAMVGRVIKYGDVAAFNALMDRRYGKPLKTKIELRGDMQPVLRPEMCTDAELLTIVEAYEKSATVDGESDTDDQAGGLPAG